VYWPANKAMNPTAGVVVLERVVLAGGGADYFTAARCFPPLFAFSC
jgi:hypothetical protein